MLVAMLFLLSGPARANHRMQTVPGVNVKSSLGGLITVAWYHLIAIESLTPVLFFFFFSM